MKGQTQAVTAILITGVIIGAVASAYIWGVPLVEKRQSQAELQQVESDAEDLERAIRSIAESGSGSSDEVQLALDSGEVNVNPGENYIEFTAFAENAPYPIDSWSLLRGQSRQGLSFGAGQFGLQGENTPGVVAVQRESGSNSVVTYRVEFRNLRTTTPSGPLLTQIDLEASGASTASGDVTVQISNEGLQGDEVTISNGESLNREKTVVEIDLR
jgi:hypothetical protein